MSRLRLALAATAVILAVASPAVAATPRDGTFKAGEDQVEYGYDLEFDVSGKGKRISGLVANVLETCSGSSTSRVTTLAPEVTWRVRKGRFSGRKKETFDGITVYTTLNGRFTSRTTAKGIVRQESIVAGSTCDTYELDFTAKRR